MDLPEDIDWPDRTQAWWTAWVDSPLTAAWTPLQWEYLLDTRLVHVTGITPAISPACRAVVTELVKRAHAAGVPLSFDINYRALL